MKSLARTFHTAVALSAIFAMPHLASAAAKVFASMSAAPASINIMAGFATNISTTVSLVDGNSGSSSVGTGSNCIFTVSISPSDPTVTSNLSVTTFTSVKSTTQNTTLTVTTTSLTPSNTYLATIL